MGLLDLTREKFGPILILTSAVGIARASMSSRPRFLFINKLRSIYRHVTRSAFRASGSWSAIGGGGRGKEHG